MGRSRNGELPSFVPRIEWLCSVCWTTNLVSTVLKEAFFLTGLLITMVKNLLLYLLVPWPGGDGSGVRHSNFGRSTLFLAAESCERYWLYLCGTVEHWILLVFADIGFEIHSELSCVTGTNCDRSTCLACFWPFGWCIPIKHLRFLWTLCNFCARRHSIKTLLLTILAIHIADKENVTLERTNQHTAIQALLTSHRTPLQIIDRAAVNWHLFQFPGFGWQYRGSAFSWYHTLRILLSCPVWSDRNYHHHDISFFVIFRFCPGGARLNLQCCWDRLWNWLLLKLRVLRSHRHLGSLWQIASKPRMSPCSTIAAARSAEVISAFKRACGIFHVLPRNLQYSFRPTLLFRSQFLRQIWRGTAATPLRTVPAWRIFCSAYILINEACILPRAINNAKWLTACENPSSKG